MLKTQVYKKENKPFTLRKGASKCMVVVAVGEGCHLIERTRGNSNCLVNGVVHPSPIRAVIEIESDMHHSTQRMNGVTGTGSGTTSSISEKGKVIVF